MGYKATSKLVTKLSQIDDKDRQHSSSSGFTCSIDSFSHLHKEVMWWIRRLLSLCKQPFVTWTDIMHSSEGSSRLEPSDIQLQTPDSLCFMRLPKDEQQDIFLVFHSEPCRVLCIQYIFNKYSGCNKECPSWLQKYPKLSLMTYKFT